MEEKPRLEGRYGPGANTSFADDQPVNVPAAPPVFSSSAERVKAMLSSWARAAVGAMLAIVLLQLQNSGRLPESKGEWSALLYAALVGGLLPMILRWLNPGDPAFGRGAK